MELHLDGFTFSDLFEPRRLAELTERFAGQLHERDPELHRRYLEYHSRKHGSESETSALLVDLGAHVGSFVARLFGIDKEYGALLLRAQRDAVIFDVKKNFLVRRVLKKYAASSVAARDAFLLDAQVHSILSALPEIPREDPELETAAGISWLLGHERFLKSGLPASSREALRGLAERLAVSLHELVPPTDSDDELKRFLSSLLYVFERQLARLYYEVPTATRDWGLLRVPRPLEFHHLVETRTTDTPVPGSQLGTHLRRRDGFHLTDPRFSLREVESEADYCIYCHVREKDSCSKGFREEGQFKTNPLGYPLRGCPLDQKISESHMLMSRGAVLGALALIMVDNPMVPGTGHRICNDCMKACIFQKQDPVNIPQIETRILTEVLDLPYGFEIYSLLTRWNPLNNSRPYMLPYNSLNILIVGLGPAGYTLAHYFLNEGFGVVALDGLKIEPLPKELIGDDRTPFAPIRDFQALRTDLSTRVPTGFGGVSEYGITVRWDKNFLTVLYLNLMRRAYFHIYDGVRFGGTLSAEDAWQYGFAHICFATGAGKPSFVTMKNNLIRGVRKASDFLMALQLTGAGKMDSMANLQVRLPALVIGGGLTAIDTATELMAYYPVQVTKIKRRYEALVAHYGREAIDGTFDDEEKITLEEFLSHAEAVDQERRRAAAVGEMPDFIPLLRSWGGVHICYRKSMLDSPAYRLNHEEIVKSLEEGISLVECVNPLEARADHYGALSAMTFERMSVKDGKWRSTQEIIHIPARTLMIAAGTVPNVMYEREHPGTFAMDDDDQYFRSFSLTDDQGRRISPVGEGDTGFFTSYAREGKYITYYGDNHPVYAGNVVRAMASAKQGYKVVLELLEDKLREARSRSTDPTVWQKLTGQLAADLRPAVVRVERLTPTITEIVVRAPKAAREFRPGQFYRLQNYEVDSPRVEETLLMMEGIALTGAWVNKVRGEIGLITLEVGASSRMCALLRPGQRVVVMGPTGTPTEITENGTVLLLGGGLGNAVLFSIAEAFKKKKNTVLYFAAYKRKEDLFKREELEAYTDMVIYSVDAGEKIELRRSTDRSCRGNIIQAMLAYARGELGPVTVPLRQASRLIAIGSDKMMGAVARARHEELKPHLHPDHTAVASINSPMQCMMKAVCAQCLQRHVDPLTGKEEFVFTCYNQDQLMDEVDFGNLNARLRGNSVMEKITNRWLDLILEKHPLPRV